MPRFTPPGSRDAARAASLLEKVPPLLWSL
jgi:hypothetical protein